MRRRLRRYIGHKVVLNTTGDSSIRGVLTDANGALAELADPEYLGEAKATGLEGKAVVPMAQLDWFQVL